MLTITSSELSYILNKFKTIGKVCYIRVDDLTKTMKLCVDLDTVNLMVDFYQTPDMLYTDKETEVSFVVPDIIKLADPDASLKLISNEDVRTITIECSKPHFTVQVPKSELTLEPFDTNYTFREMDCLQDIHKAVSLSKGLAQELSNNLMIELCNDMWLVHTSQSCYFGRQTVLKGSLPYSTFEKIYDPKLKIGFAQISDTVLMSKCRYAKYDVYMKAPLQDEYRLAPALPKIVERCNSKYYDVMMSEDVSTVCSGLITNVKKDKVNVVFSDNDVNLNYISNLIELNTKPGTKGLTIQVPIRTLSLIKDMCVVGCELYSDMEVICLLNETKGLILSGPIY